MSWFSKIVWSEGLFLRPQHFQQQERNTEWMLNAHERSTAAFAWGFAKLEVDEATLTTGKVYLKSAAGVMPDGTAFDFPDHSVSPVALDIPDGTREHLICLGLPARRPYSAEFSGLGSEDPLARYSIEDDSVIDSTCSSAAPEAIQLGQPRFVLDLESRLSDAYLKLGVLRVVERRADNSLILDRSYIPPVLASSVSSILDGFRREIEGLLKQRGDALAGRLTQAGSGGVSEIADFLFLLTVNRYQPIFEHLSGIYPLHPERLYTEMLRLAAELSTLVSSERRPSTLPAYIHDKLQSCFEPLMRDIRRALSTILDQNAIQIELVDHKQGRYVGMIADRGLLRQASFVLAVNAQIPSETLRARFPTQAKLGPVERIRELVNLQLPGIALRPLPVAPRQIPFHAGFSYFELDSTGDLWRQLDSSGGLGMYVSGEFPALEVSLWAIRA